MKTVTYFDTLWGDEWPSLDWLEPHFQATPQQMSPIQERSGGGTFRIEGAGGADHLERDTRRVDVVLRLAANPKYGITLNYQKFGGGVLEIFVSKGDLRRRLDWVETPQGTPLSVGLFIPIERGWSAIKQFIEGKGALPTAIEWVATQDLPSDTFPSPETWKHLKIEAT